MRRIVPTSSLSSSARRRALRLKRIQEKSASVEGEIAAAHEQMLWHAPR